MKDLKLKCHKLAQRKEVKNGVSTLTTQGAGATDFDLGGISTGFYVSLAMAVVQTRYLKALGTGLSVSEESALLFNFNKK